MVTLVESGIIISYTVFTLIREDPVGEWGGRGFCFLGPQYPLLILKDDKRRQRSEKLYPEAGVSLEIAFKSWPDVKLQQEINNQLSGLPHLSQKIKAK